MMLDKMMVPVVMSDGTKKVLTAAQVLERAHDIADLGYASRLVRAAMLRHMVVWSEVGIPDVPIDQYAQYADLPDDAKTNEVNLLHIVKGSTQNWLFDPKVGNPPMTPSETLSLILAGQTFVSYRAQVFGSSSPLPSVYQLPVFNTVGQTIDGIRAGLSGFDKGRPSWEENIPHDATVMPMTGWLNHFTLAPHRLQMVVDSDGLVRTIRGKEQAVDPTFKRGDWFADHLAYTGPVSYKDSPKKLRFVGLDTVFKDYDATPALLAMSGQPGFTGWETVGRLTGGNGETRGTLAVVARLPHGTKGAAPYAKRWDEAKFLVWRTAKTASELTRTKTLPYRFYMVDEVCDIFERAIAHRTKPTEVMAELSSMLLDTLDRATVVADPKVWVKEKTVHNYQTLRNDLIETKNGETK